MTSFKLITDFKPAGDQPKAIKKLIYGLDNNYQEQTLLGVTGSGKTYTMANIIAQAKRPTLVISHNKTLAAQLYSEFKQFFPQNAVHYFVSYYDYYQPEAYIVRTDTYIQKDSSINEEIDRLRHAATMSLLTRRDVIIVASVSCIYGLGNIEDYNALTIKLKTGLLRQRDKLIRQLTDIQYKRNDIGFVRGTFRVRGDTIEIHPSGEEIVWRIEFFGDKIERIRSINALTGELLEERKELAIFPASHYVASETRLKNAIKQIRKELMQRLLVLKSQNKLLEAQRLEQRTNYDLEMLEEVGFVSGIENYSRYLSNREQGEQPATLLDYFPDDFLMFIDESHMTIPQIRGMYNGDRSRKETLVEHGFRLPSALDNRPLKFNEFSNHINQVIYTSATPNDYELDKSQQIVEQIIRPTGLLDPEVIVRSANHQIDNLIYEIQKTIQKGQRVLVTTLTKRMAEDLTDYLQDLKIKVQYLHSEIHTLDRLDIIHNLRIGVYDVIVGINLLREGLDLPEVSLIGIIDADKEGFLRSEQALIQTIGRAARHIEGKVIMYADRITNSMKNAIEVTKKRRRLQKLYNQKHFITPKTIQKAIREKIRAEEKAEIIDIPTIKIDHIPKEEQAYLIKEITARMELAAQNLQFEKAAKLRDQIKEINNIKTNNT